MPFRNRRKSAYHVHEAERLVLFFLGVNSQIFRNSSARKWPGALRDGHDSRRKGKRRLFHKDSFSQLPAKRAWEFYFDDFKTETDARVCTGRILRLRIRKCGITSRMEQFGAEARPARV